MSEIGFKSLLRQFSDKLRIRDVKQFPSVLDTSDVKVVYPINVNEPYEEFAVTVDDSVTNNGPEITIPMFRVGGLASNGVSVSGQVNCGGGGVDGTGPQDEPSAIEWDYLILEAAMFLQYDATALTADTGAQLDFGWNFASEVLVGSPFYIGMLNVNDGKTVDADEQRYWFTLYGSNAGFALPSLWRGFIPGRLGNGFDFHIIHRNSADVRTAFPAGGSSQMTGRVHGIRFKKGYFPL